MSPQSSLHRLPINRQRWFNYPMGTSVLFICSRNAGKSQMAASLMEHFSAGRITGYSAGTKPGEAVNPESLEVIAETGADMSEAFPKPIDPDIVAQVDRVVILGSEAHPVFDASVRTERWLLSEPSDEGYTGIERMRRIRDDIAERVRSLSFELEK